MANLTFLEKFTATLPPFEVSEEMRNWLDEEFARVEQTLNIGLAELDRVRFFQEDGLLDGPADQILISEAPVFTPALNYAIARESTIKVDAVAGTITLPPLPGFIEITMFYSMTQVTLLKDFSVVSHLEVNGVVAPQSSGTGYIPQQSDDIPLTISTVKARPVLGGEIFRMMFQLEDVVGTDATFDILDSTFKIRYLELDDAVRLLLV